MQEIQVILSSSPKPRRADTDAVQVSALRRWRRMFPSASITGTGVGESVPALRLIESRGRKMRLRWDVQYLSS